jgi:hypothetical protein
VPESLTLQTPDCALHVNPRGDAVFERANLRASFEEPLPQAGAPSSDCRVSRVGERIVVECSRGGFKLERTLSLTSRSDRCGLLVQTVAVSSVPRPFTALVDYWRCASPTEFDFRWIPNLRPGQDLRAGSHSFRSPAVLLSGPSGGIALVPDFSSGAARLDSHLCALDLDVKSAEVPQAGYGIAPTRPSAHTYFELDPTTQAHPDQPYRYDYFVMLDVRDRGAFLRMVSSFLWSRFAAPYVPSDLPQTVPYDAYAGYAYPSLVASPPFVTFDINGRKAGGIRAEKAHAEYFKRPDPIVWNQAWFNGQRSAYGMGAFGKKLKRADWLEAGRLITAATLSAPDWDGLWPAIYAFEDGEWWGSIPKLNGGRNRIQVADAALTGEWLLRWTTDVEGAPGAIERVRTLAERLCRLQDKDGSIPPWFDFDGSGLRADATLRHSAETGAATAFLGEVASRAGFEWASTSVLRGAEFLATEVMPGQKYQDYETFFSCSSKPLDMVDPFTRILPQNSLAVFWTARTMLAAYRLSSRQEFLRLAEEATDILSLYQQVWNPPFLNLYAFGGFGVMNTDAEWNDARQSLFAPHYFAMHEATGLDEYLERGRAALKASFVLASIPENASVSPNTFESYPPGLMPENYGHSGRDTPAGRSDACWGEAGALSSVAWLRLHYGDLMTDLHR